MNVIEAGRCAGRTRPGIVKAGLKASAAVQGSTESQGGRLTSVG